MLVANDQSWAICLPKKTGSQSLVGMLGPEGAGVADVVGAYHDAKWDGDGRRYLIVRDPHERLASMFWYSLKERQFCAHPDVRVWIDLYLSQQRGEHNAEWLMTCAEAADEFRPTRVFRLEDGLMPVLDAVGVTLDMLPDGLQHVQFRNVTKAKYVPRLSAAETFAPLTDEQRARVDAWAAPDKGRFYA